MNEVVKMNGIVYCVECEDTGEKYVGATLRRLIERMWSHKSDVNRYDNGKEKNKKSTVYDIIKNGNYKSYILGEYKVDNLRELNVWERKHIENTECINKNIPYRVNRSDKKPVDKISKSESDRRYRNGEKREEILQKKRDYAEENKEKIKEYRGQVIECECGGTYQLNHKAGHLKTLFHRRRVEPELIEKDNKEKEDRRKNTLEKNAKVVDCECGVSYTFGNRQRHFNSARHINYI